MKNVARHGDLARWWGMSASRERDLGALKEAFVRRGLGRRAWRLYLDYGDALFEPLKPVWLSDDKPFSTPERAARYLGLLQALESDVPPQAPFVQAMLAWHIPEQRIESIPPRFLKAAWKRYTLAELQGDALKVLSDEITPVARWFINEANKLHDNGNLLKAGWASLLRACAEAHEEQEEEVPIGTAWFPIVRECAIGLYRIVAILNQKDLVEEATAMQHCIASYGQWFATELARPFSIRCCRSGVRLASMVVFQSDEGLWQIDQVRGYQNAVVAPALHEAASSVLRTIDDAITVDPELAARIGEVRRQQPKDSAFSCPADACLPDDYLPRR